MLILDDDIRLACRILRDSKERGRSVESVINQYVEVVKPHHQFIGANQALR